MQIAALPWRKGKAGIEILLITSRETKRWVIPKGWPMLHLKDFNAAKREAHEEAGVEGRVRRNPIGLYTYEKKLKDQSMRSLGVHVYGLEVVRMLSHWPEYGQRLRQWQKQDAAAKLVQEPQLEFIIKNFRP